jgi:hypothetical protein
MPLAFTFHNAQLAFCSTCDYATGSTSLSKPCHLHKNLAYADRRVSWYVIAGNVNADNVI